MKSEAGSSRILPRMLSKAGPSLASTDGLLSHWCGYRPSSGPASGPSIVRVVALKGYLGYLHFEPAHANYRRYYELAAKYKLPVMFHTGDTYSPKAKLKFAHPLGVDEVAVDHPDTRFLICHIGNPWVTDAAEVIYKNMNVWADLSGLVVGDESAFTSEEGRDRIAHRFGGD